MKNKGFGVVSVVAAVISIALLVSAAWLGAAAVARRGFEKGTEALSSGDYALALEHLLRAEKFSLRKDAPLLTALGAAREGTGDDTAAKEYYERAAASDGSAAEARYRLAKIYIKEKDLDSARAQAAALENLATEESENWAREVRKEIRMASMKSLFDDVAEKIPQEFRFWDKSKERRGTR